MSDRNFKEMLEAQWANRNFVCVGLDSQFEKIPEFVRLGGNKDDVHENAIVAFNQAIVEATNDLVCAYKPNSAFYEAHGAEGILALKRTIANIHTIAPKVPVILDAKRADIGNTNAGYVKFAFGYLKADAITVHPYLGGEALRPFLEKKEKGIFVLCCTSNPGASEFQGVGMTFPFEEGKFIAKRKGSYCMTEGGHFGALYEHMAYQVSQEWNTHGNCGLVAGATYPFKLEKIRRIVDDMPILIPGIGAQGGDLEATVKAGKDSRGRGMIINSSRSIIFASEGVDFAEAARRETEKLRNFINTSIESR